MYRLDVVASDFRLMLKQVKVHTIAAARIEAGLSFSEGAAKLEVGSMGIRFYAKGEWPGEARFSASLVYALKHYPPIGDVAIIYDNHALTIGTSKVAATWNACIAEGATIPDDADWVATLVIAARERGFRRDHGSSLRTARRELARRIAHAADELASLGITQSDLRALVEVRLLERGPADKYFRIEAR